MEIRWYVDKPGRDLSLCRPNDRVYIDIEPGCFEDADDVRNEGTRLTNHRLVTGIYGNANSIPAVFGASKELAEWPCPLWLASWGVVPFRDFQPFMGWKMPEMWQVSEKGYAGVNLDVNFDDAGRPWADFGNYTTLQPATAWWLARTFYGCIIGLQDLGLARYNLDMLTVDVPRT